MAYRRVLDPFRYVRSPLEISAEQLATLVPPSAALDFMVKSKWTTVAAQRSAVRSNHNELSRARLIELARPMARTRSAECEMPNRAA